MRVIPNFPISDSENPDTLCVFIGVFDEIGSYYMWTMQVLGRYYREIRNKDKPATGSAKIYTIKWLNGMIKRTVLIFMTVDYKFA